MAIDPLGKKWDTAVERYRNLVPNEKHEEVRAAYFALRAQTMEPYEAMNRAVDAYLARSSMIMEDTSQEIEEIYRAQEIWESLS